jgi:cell fate (sporulation/competence/biofilm development) regulator YmcA (YheA/YmcA/DUF963 family)
MSLTKEQYEAHKRQHNAQMAVLKQIQRNAQAVVDAAKSKSLARIRESIKHLRQSASQHPVVRHGLPAVRRGGKRRTRRTRR